MQQSLSVLSLIVSRNLHPLFQCNAVLLKQLPQFRNQFINRHICFYLARGYSNSCATFSFTFIRSLPVSNALSCVYKLCNSHRSLCPCRILSTNLFIGYPGQFLTRFLLLSALPQEIHHHRQSSFYITRITFICILFHIFQIHFILYSIGFCIFSAISEFCNQIIQRRVRLSPDSIHIAIRFSSSYNTSDYGSVKAKYCVRQLLNHLHRICIILIKDKFSRGTR